jgi:hypothetical protein
LEEERPNACVDTFEHLSLLHRECSFYKKIASNKGSARLVAIFPQSVEEGRAYLTRLDIDVDEVRQFRLESIGVEGTPTLLLINSSGVVTERWVGRLMPDQELVVLRALENLSS